MQGEDFHLAVGETCPRLGGYKVLKSHVKAKAGGKKFTPSGGRDAPQVRFYEGFYRLRYSLNREKVCT